MQSKNIGNANGNVPQTDEEKNQIIKNASMAYEVFMDALMKLLINVPNN